MSFAESFKEMMKGWPTVDLAYIHKWTGEVLKERAKEAKARLRKEDREKKVADRAVNPVAGIQS